MFKTDEEYSSAEIRISRGCWLKAGGCYWRETMSGHPTSRIKKKWWYKLNIKKEGSMFGSPFKRCRVANRTTSQLRVNISIKHLWPHNEPKANPLIQTISQYLSHFPNVQKATKKDWGIVTRNISPSQIKTVKTLGSATHFGSRL